MNKDVSKMKNLDGLTLVILKVFTSLVLIEQVTTLGVVDRVTNGVSFTSYL